MADDENGYQTRVYRYRVLGDLPDEALAELRRAHELSNLLVEIEKRHADRVAEAWREYPELLQLEEAIGTATEAIEEVAEEVSQYKRRNRTGKVPPELKEKLKAARVARRDAKAAFRDEKAIKYPLLKPKLVLLADRLRAEIKATYAESVAGGLYWANYNAITDRHRRAVQAVKTRRKQGLVADLRYRRWTGEGTLNVQLQRSVKQPARTPATIADDSGPWHNVAQLTPAHNPDDWGKLSRAEQRRIRLGMLRFRVGAGEEAGWVELPIIVHRPIPPDADICMAEITRRRLGSRMLVHASIVVRLPVTPARTEGGVVAIHVGWRALPDRAIRVAVLAGATSPPDEITGVVRCHGNWSEIVIPAWWRDQMDYVQSLTSIRDRNLDATKAWVLAWLGQHPNHSIAGIETIDKWRSQNRFAALSMRLRNDDSIDLELRRQLEAWRVQDRHLWDIEANLRAKILARRNDAFAKVAAWSLENAALLVADNYKLPPLMRKPGLSDEDLEAHRRARANRVLAAPGTFRNIMVDAAKRRGVYVESVGGEISSLHGVCGTNLDAAERETSVMVWCPKCQTMVDQDSNTLDMLRTYQPTGI